MSELKAVKAVKDPPILSLPLLEEARAVPPERLLTPEAAAVREAEQLTVQPEAAERPDPRPGQTARVNKREALPAPVVPAEEALAEAPPKSVLIIPVLPVQTAAAVTSAVLATESADLPAEPAVSPAPAAAEEIMARLAVQAPMALSGTGLIAVPAEEAEERETPEATAVREAYTEEEEEEVRAVTVAVVKALMALSLSNTSPGRRSLISDGIRIMPP